MENNIFKPANSKYYHLRYRLEGQLKPKQKSLDTVIKEVAEKKAQEFLRNKQMEIAGILPPKELREAAIRPILKHLEDFIEDISRLGRNRKHLAHTRNRIMRLCKDCGWQLIGDVSAQSFIKWRSAQKELSPKTCNEYLGHLSAFLNWLERCGCLAYNPLKTVTKAETRGKETVVRRALSEEEIGKILAISGKRSLVYRLAIYTGLRRGEIQSLVWDDLILEGGAAIYSGESFHYKE